MISPDKPSNPQLERTDMMMTWIEHLAARFATQQPRELSTK
ncbi:MAG: hypothetical protein WCF18_08325 [Chthoniobacteraceae bacterium]